MTTTPMMILIAGPYRSGTGDDPVKMAANLKRLEKASWPLFRAGHVPTIGEWVALPIWHHGSNGTASRVMPWWITPPVRLDHVIV